MPEVKIHKTTPPPQPPRQITHVDIRLTPKEAKILWTLTGRIHGGNEDNSPLGITNDADLHKFGSAVRTLTSHLYYQLREVEDE